MNYRQIYNELIANSLAKDSEVLDSEVLDSEVYTEIHHVVTKSREGDHDASNLVALTAKDHLFVHLPLTKACGGNQWAAVEATSKLVGQGWEDDSVP